MEQPMNPRSLASVTDTEEHRPKENWSNLRNRRAHRSSHLCSSDSISTGTARRPGQSLPAEAPNQTLSPKPGAARRPETDTPSVRAFWHFGSGATRAHRAACSVRQLDLADHVAQPIEAHRTLAQ